MVASRWAFVSSALSSASLLCSTIASLVPIILPMSAENFSASQTMPSASFVTIADTMSPIALNELNALLNACACSSFPLMASDSFVMRETRMVTTPTMGFAAINLRALFAPVTPFAKFPPMAEPACVNASLMLFV